MEKHLKKKIQNIKIGMKKKTDMKASGNTRIKQKGLEGTFFKLKDPGVNTKCRHVHQCDRHISGFV
jgi:hypothetical protein